MNETGITCFKTGWAALLDVTLWVKWWDLLCSIATVGAVVIALVAAYIAYQQLQSNVKETRNATANNIYQQYLLLCMEKPEFSNGMAKPDAICVEYGKYCWFVSTMLFTFEQILETQKSDPKWEKTIKSQLNRHKELLNISSTIREEQWDDELQTIINEVIDR